ncbi:MAG: ester cyclase [Dethiobacteria bacterium]|nr:ester cyclase [Bacillota bacterium]
MITEEIKTRFIQAVKDGWQNGNLDAWDMFYAPDCVFHKPPFPDTAGLKNVKESTKDTLGAYTDIKVEIDGLIAEGNMSSWQSTWQATHSGQSASLPIPPTGKRVTLSSCLVNRWQDGKIVEEWEYSDHLGFLQQLGIVPQMG